MAVQPHPHRFSVEEYHRMAEVGLLRPDVRTELLEGAVLEMAAIGSRHAECVNRLTALFVTRLGDRAAVSVQNPVRLDRYSEPQPDLALVRKREGGYADAHPGPIDTLLVVEVADTTVGWDRAYKIPLYAAAGVPEAWLVDLPSRTVEGHHQPTDAGYAAVGHFAPGDHVAPAFAPDVRLPVADLIP